MKLINVNVLEYSTYSSLLLSMPSILIGGFDLLDATVGFLDRLEIVRNGSWDMIVL
jgi:hypothetical protein